MEHFDIAAFVKERDEVFLSGDVDRVIAYHKKWSPGVAAPSREVVEIAMHKARTAITSFPQEARDASITWLKERGYAPYLQVVNTTSGPDKPDTHKNDAT